MILIMSLILELLEGFAVWLRKGEKQKNIKTQNGEKKTEKRQKSEEVGKETKTNAKATRRHKIGRKNIQN